MKRATERVLRGGEIVDWQPPENDPILAAKRLDAIEELGRPLTGNEALNWPQVFPTTTGRLSRRGLSPTLSCSTLKKL